jgi:hypothetical protein
MAGALSFRVAGTGPPVLLVHGGAEDLGMLSPAGRGVRRARPTRHLVRPPRHRWKYTRGVAGRRGGGTCGRRGEAAGGPRRGPRDRCRLQLRGRDRARARRPPSRRRRGGDRVGTRGPRDASGRCGAPCSDHGADRRAPRRAPGRLGRRLRRDAGRALRGSGGPRRARRTPDGRQRRGRAARRRPIDHPPRLRAGRAARRTRHPSPSEGAPTPCTPPSPTGSPRSSAGPRWSSRRPTTTRSTCLGRTCSPTHWPRAGPLPPLRDSRAGDRRPIDRHVDHVCRRRRRGRGRRQRGHRQ